MSELVPFVKAKRAATDQDDETWREGGVSPTLNDFDNGTESRATVIIAFGHTQGLDPQASEQVTPTLRKEGGGGAVSATEGVRRLTPIECERLQGFPDNWTAHRIQQKGRRAGQLVEQADAPRYKQMGNAVTVNVVEWILAGIVEAES